MTKSPIMAAVLGAVLSAIWYFGQTWVAKFVPMAYTNYIGVVLIFVAATIMFYFFG